jgi:hypothetical protein
LDGTPATEIIAIARTLLREKPPRQIMPAILPAAFAKRDLGKPYRPRGLGDRLAVLSAAITGRI